MIIIIDKINPYFMALSDFTSQKFRFWSFVSMMLLVFVHAYNLDIRYMQPWTMPGQPLTFTSFTEYFLANGIFRFRIPMLFIISGFLYAMHDQKPNKVRIRKRLQTLLIPYLLWSALGILMIYLIEMTVWGRDMVTSSSMLQIDEKRMLIHEYHWYEVLGRWLFFPVPYQLWFIRVLLIYNLAYPAIRWCVQHKTARWIFFGFALLMWLSTMGVVFVEGEGLLFFSLGIWIQKNNFSIESPEKYFRPLWWGIAFVSLAALKTWIAFDGEPILGNAVPPVLIILHKMVVLTGLIACWYGLDKLASWCMRRNWFVWLSAFSFMIYAMHAPIVALLINPVLQWLGPLPYGQHLAAFIGLPVVMIIAIIALSATMRKLLPRVYGILTGNRGLQI